MANQMSAGEPAFIGAGHRRAESTYARHGGSLTQWHGWFALTCGDRLGGLFPTYQAAAVAWLRLYGPVPALIRRIDAAELAAPDRPTLAACEALVPHGFARVVYGWALPGGLRKPPAPLAA